jgi:3-dehydrosphinganine reductase
MTRVAGSHVLVTGGSEGIGLAFATACIRRGARVSIVARSEDKLTAARERLGGTAAAASADVTDPEALARAVAVLTDRHGPIEIVVTAAGGAEPGYFLDLDPEVFRRQIELNYLGTVHAVRAVLPGMLARGEGHLVLVSSIAGLYGVFGYGAYTPSKFAVRGLGQALDAEFRPRGLRVSVVYPPDTRTPGFARENRTKPPETARIAAGIRPVTPERVAVAILQGIERNRLAITADWQNAVVARMADLHGPLVRSVMRRRLR